MNCKRIFAAALALIMATSTAAFAAEIPEGWTPADGARVAQKDNYETVITINGEALVSYEYTKEIPGSWETETIVKQLNEIAAVPTGYVPLRAVAQADHGSAYWDAEENQSWFNLGDVRIVTYFDDMSVEVDDEIVEGVSALLIKGVTYIPVSVIDSLDGYSVTDNSADGVESYEITTPNGTPLMKLAYALMETAEMGLGNKVSFEDMEMYYEDLGFKAEFITEGVAYLPMMMTPDTLILGKVAEGKTGELQAALEKFRERQATTFETYLSHNMPKIENAKFVTEGGWFLFLIAENADEAVEQFQAAVAEMD